jgi:phosphatidylinositol glycan class B
MTEADRTLRRSIIILGAVTLVTAWFSNLFYFPDEHFQVVEFLGLKLGITPPSAMAPEYPAHVRSWMQPFIYWLIAAPLRALGLNDMFAMAFVLRAFTGMFSVAALAAFAKSLALTFDNRDEQQAFLGYLPLFGFLPFLFVRTSSETMSAAFFALGLAAILSGRSRVFAGLLCGLAFECRYQTGLMTAGLMAWLAIAAREKFSGLLQFAGGGVLALVLGLLVDRWGYGFWVFPPVDYVHRNLMEGVADSYGRDPVLAYLWMLPAQLFFVITFVLIAAMVMMWLRNPRHVLTWVTLPFVLGHMAIAHKEARFLFPLAILATAFPVLGFSPRLPRWRRFAERLWAWRRSWAARVTTGLSVFGMAFLAIYPLGVRPHMPMTQYLYRHAAGTVYVWGKALPDYPIYRRDGLTLRPTDPAQIPALLADGPVYLLTDRPALPPLPPGTRAEMLYSEFLPARFGRADWGVALMNLHQVLARDARFLQLIPLYYFTLYRLERPAATQ